LQHKIAGKYYIGGIDKRGKWCHNIYMEENFIELAKAFANEMHKGQLRDDPKEPYINHCERVYAMVRKLADSDKSFDADFACVVAILHDTLEDTQATAEQIEELFGIDVAFAVIALTKNKILPTPFLRTADSIERIKKQPREVAIVKLCDRMDNIASVNSSWSKEKSLDYARESEYIAGQLEFSNERLAQKLKDNVAAYHEKIEEFYSSFGK
jgi:(p)ppGpp synthase/HD superfamily hydrolase